MTTAPLLQQVDDLVVGARNVAEQLDVDTLGGDAAIRVYRSLEQAGRSIAAAKTILAARIEQIPHWKTQGFRSAADFLAREGGTSVGAAKAELETGAALRSLPETRQALLAGNIPREQGTVIAGAAKHNPAAEQQLLVSAGKANLRELREEAARAKAAADADPEATERRLHAERKAGWFVDPEGAFNLRGRGTAADGAVVSTELQRLADGVFRAHASSTSVEPRDAYQWDALVEMARRSARADDASPDGKRRQPRPEHLALLRLDITALWRGYIQGDELCEITGLGPIPVARARELLGDAVLKLIITNGVDVAHITSLTRGPTQAMRYAALWTSPSCLVEGCTNTIVQHDHRFGAEFKDTQHTRLDELDRLCTHHHDLHTRFGWALVLGTGKRPVVPPEDPRHPGHGPP